MVHRRFYLITVVILLTLFTTQTEAQKPAIYKITRMSFNKESFSDISPVIIKDGIIFCSNRRFSALKDRTSFDGRRLYNIYQVEQKDTAIWSNPKEILSERSSKFNNGALCIAPDGKTVYFTSDVETGKAAKNKNYKNHNGIFIADRSGMDLISIRPFKYNNAAYNVAMPSVSSDGKLLFFSSDMPGGQGGSDLYYCKLINGEWGEPQNLGAKVNSPKSENYPFMHASGRLYFASTRPGGLGGMDIYYTTFTSGKWDDPVHLPDPINSTSDDFAFVAQDNLQTGYLASNRNTSDDIYEFKSLIIRKPLCDTLVENSFCFRFVEENALNVDTLPFRYEWKFGDGSKSTGIVVEHCYDNPGTYIVQLDVVNLITKEVLRNQKSDTLMIKEIEQPYITVVDKTDMGQKINLSADKTNLPGWNINSYYWNFGDESIGTGKEIDHTYLKSGTYSIQLIVTAEAEPGGSVREACISKNIIITPKP